MASPQSPLSTPQHYSLFLAIFSLAVGGFCIGTTEFVAMGLIQEIANNLNITVPEAGHFISAYALGFEFSATIAFVTLIAVGFFVPNIPVQATASIKTELAGLKNINMWLTLAVGAIGFGGMFSVYSYVSPILTEYTQVNIQIVPIALAIWGIGMVIGGLVAGWLADKNLNKTIVGVLISSAIAFVVASFLMSNIYTAIASLFLIGLTVMGLGGALQTRLMDVAGDAQTLAASLNHSAFNMANALGAFLGGWVLSHQMGWIAPIWVGFVLSLGGLIILLIAFAVEKASKKA
ncbi:MFS transporter [Acinetobacter geminorum]|uniref:MFS transporter n=1 Tax=Acinetobacter geminorum TaxID=2730922 RepID=UPI003AF4D926